MFNILVPYMTAKKYGELVGLSESTILKMMERGHLASVKVGKRRLVNVAVEFQGAVEDWKAEALGVE